MGCVPFFGDTPEELFAHVINDEIEWPDEDEWPLPDESKHLISQLLQQTPLDRLGTGGAHEVKDHSFFFGINWDALLRQKAEFVPQLTDEDDTSYFDTRSDRYNHEVMQDEMQSLDESCMMDMDGSSLFSSFSSCSPRYHKVYSRIEKELAQEKLLKSSSTSAVSLDETITGPRSNRSVSSSVVESKPEVSSLSRTRSLTSGHSSTSSVTKDSKDRAGGVPEDKSVLLLSHSESGEESPKRRKRPPGGLKCTLPRFSISIDPPCFMGTPTSPCTPSIREIPPTDEAPTQSPPVSANDPKGVFGFASSARIPIPTGSGYNSDVQPGTSRCQQRARAVIKSASTSGLSLIIPSAEERCRSSSLNTQAGVASPGNSSASSRDTSPNREMNSLTASLKPPIIIRKGPRGFGFTLKAIRVYYGDTDIYSVNHLVMSVENNSPAFDSGLRPGDLITHINGEAVQGLLHPQVLQLILSGGDKMNIRTIPLENTTIKTGGRKRNPTTSKLVRRPVICKHRRTPPIRRADSDKRRRSTLFRRLSSKRAGVEMQQLMASSCVTPSSPVMTPSRSFQSLSQGKSFVSSTPTGSTPVCPEARDLPCVTRSPPTSASTVSGLSVATGCARIPRSPPHSHPRFQCSPSDSSAGNSSQSTSPGSSVPNSPGLVNSSQYQRPSSLHGLKHKLVKTFRTTNNLSSPRRKSCGHIPLSPLARTPSPSVLVGATSPTRSPSPLAFPVGHVQHPSISQTTQTFVRSSSISHSQDTSHHEMVQYPPRGTSPLVASLNLSPAVKVPLSPRPKSAEPDSPLFGRMSASPEKVVLKAGLIVESTGGRPKSPAIRFKREGCSVASPLAVSSLPPSLSKIAVTNCFTQNISKGSDSSGGSEYEDVPRVPHHNEDRNRQLLDEKLETESNCSSSSSSSSECSIKTSKEEKDVIPSKSLKSDDQTSSSSPKGSKDESISITPGLKNMKISSEDGAGCSSPPVTSTSQAEGGTSSAPVTSTKSSTGKKSDKGSKSDSSRSCSPLNFRKALFSKSDKSKSKNSTKSSQKGSGGGSKK